MVQTANGTTQVARQSAARQWAEKESTVVTGQRSRGEGTTNSMQRRKQKVERPSKSALNIFQLAWRIHGATKQTLIDWFNRRTMSTCFRLFCLLRVTHEDAVSVPASHWSPSDKNAMFKCSRHSSKKDSIGGQVFIGRCIHQPPGGACYEANRGRVNIRSSFGRMVASIKKGRDIQTQQVGRQMSEIKTRGTRVDSYTADV